MGRLLADLRRRSTVDHTDRALMLLIVVALAAATFLAIGRVGIEQSNRTVELIVDADDARQLATAVGVSFPTLLADLKMAGATAVAVREMTLEELVQVGRVIAFGHPQGTLLATTDGEVSSLIALGSALQSRLPKASLGVSTRTPALVLYDVSFDQIAKVPIELRPEDVAAARALSLRLVARPVNFAAASPEAIRAAVRQAAQAGARLIIFRDDEVVGYPLLLNVTAEALRRGDLLYGYVEIAAQKGDDQLSAKLASQMIRVHSITDADLQTITPDLAVARYLRAVRERNIRACYLRLLSRPQPDPLRANTDYLRRVAKAIEGAGFRIGPPGPFRSPEEWPPLHLRVLVLLALPAASVLLLRRLVPVGQRWAWLVLVAVTALGFALAYWRAHLVVPVSGLAAACIFPALGIIFALQWARQKATAGPHSNSLGLAFLALAGACAISFIGAMVIVGLFSRAGYLVGAGRFVGVKLSYLSPLLIVLLVVIGDLPGRVEPLSLWWTRLRLRVGEFLSRPVAVMEALAILIALGAVAFALMRSGNESAVAPSAIELKLRNALESLLIVRPRTKEFLIGYPALMLVIALALRGRRQWLPLLALLATMGQISLLNTFCHFHIPLLVSLLRTLHGFWIGALVGLVVVLVWQRLCVRRPRAEQT